MPPNKIIHPVIAERKFSRMAKKKAAAGNRIISQKNMAADSVGGRFGGSMKVFVGHFLFLTISYILNPDPSNTTLRERSERSVSGVALKGRRRTGCHAHFAWRSHPTRKPLFCVRARPFIISQNSIKNAG